MKPSKEKLAKFRKNSENWAKERLGDRKTLILDVETTGILSKDPDTEIAQISIVNAQGRPVFSMLVKPSKPMTQELIDIHGITNEMVMDAPTFPQIAKMLSFILDGKHLIAYNADFDLKLLWHLYKRYNIEPPKTSGASCAMDRFSEWSGEWNDKKEGFKWQRLPNLSALPAHDALSDCLSTLKVLELMSGLYNPSEASADEIDLSF
jgi:DNA polymerase-3 subunit epsilon